MRKRLKAILLTALIGILSAIPVSATELQWEKVTFKMAVPDGVAVDGPVYVMYTGKDTDLFAELSADNNYTSEVNAIPGTYDIYQISPGYATDLSFMATSKLTIAADNPTVNIYIRNTEGLLNADITEGEVPSDLATYGEMIAKQVEAEQDAEQQKIRQQQEEAGNETFEGQGTLTTQPGVQGADATADPSGRETKIKSVTATEDAATGVTGLVIIGACILGIGILIIIAVMLRKYKKIKEGDNNANNRPQNSNSIGNR